MSRQREKRAGKTIPNVGGMHRSKHRLEIQDVFCKNVCLTNLQLRDFPHQLFEKHKHKKHRPFDFATINTIKLSSNKISRIPAQISWCKHLTSLDLSHNLLNHVPEEINDLGHLEELRLHHNKLATLVPLCGLPRLRFLDLGVNRLTSMPVCPNNIEVLIIKANQIRVIEGLGACQHTLLSLDASANKLTAVSLVADRLETLCLHVNQLATFPDITAPCLQELNLKHNSIVEVPSSVGELRLLRVLGLDRNRLVRIAPHVARLRRLVTLRLEHNRLGSLPTLAELEHEETAGGVGADDAAATKGADAATAAHHVTSTATAADEAEGRPPRLLARLRDVTLHHNLLAGFPEDNVFAESEVATLDLSHNPLDRTGHMTGLRQLPALQDLNLSHSQITELPILTPCVRLEQLRLVNCRKVRALPAWLFELPCLSTLNAERCAIATIDCDGPGRALATIDLRHNALKQLPEAMVASPVLATLLASDNDLADLPFTLLEAQRLRHLGLVGNPRLSRPPGVGRTASDPRPWLKMLEDMELPPK
eukprot:m.255705 g.255705  ORF g.255705 m.255705 type:complete len:537 (+) comp19165_c0_seq1:186-1796(+)